MICRRISSIVTNVLVDNVQKQSDSTIVERSKESLIAALHALAGSSVARQSGNACASLLPPLSDDLREVLLRTRTEDLQELPGKGLAHDHISLGDSMLLLRIPRQSQLALNAQDNLQYQGTCFARMLPSGCTPACHALLSPSEELQMGALLVEQIAGRTPASGDDFQAMAKSLASIHRLALPAVSERAPLYDQQNSLVDTLSEVVSQASYLNRGDISPGSLSMITEQLELARAEVDSLEDPPSHLISFDAHPGNFLIEREGRAILVDLEKGRYGGCGFDLAHATLYTSTTWDTEINIELKQAVIEKLYTKWLFEMPDVLGASMQSTLIPMRRLMWLWSVTWCAKWRVESKATQLRHKHQAQNTEDWAMQNSPDALVAHVQERTNHYLQEEIIHKITTEFETLAFT